MSFQLVAVGWWCVMEVYVCRALVLAHSFPSSHAPASVFFWVSITISRSLCISPNSFSCKGSYLKYRDEGSQIFWIWFGGGCRAGCRLRDRLMFSWWCVYGRVYADFWHSC